MLQELAAYQKCLLRLLQFPLVPEICIFCHPAVGDQGSRGPIHMLPCLLLLLYVSHASCPLTVHDASIRRARNVIMPICYGSMKDFHNAVKFVNVARSQAAALRTSFSLR